MEVYFTTESIIAFLSLASLEIVLGIDNIVFIALVVDRLDPKYQARTRFIGLALAMVMRIGLLFAIGWVMSLTKPLFSYSDHPFAMRELILLGGGLFLIAKATHEIHNRIEGPSPETQVKKAASVAAALVQIILLDMIFSLDSVITAIGMVDHIPIMIAAIIVAVLVMMIFANSVSNFIKKHPTLKMLALSFLLLIGVMLVAESLGQHIDRGYIYFAMGFSLFVETLNIKSSRALRA